MRESGQIVPGVGFGIGLTSETVQRLRIPDAIAFQQGRVELGYFCTALVPVFRASMHGHIDFPSPL